MRQGLRYLVHAQSRRAAHLLATSILIGLSLLCATPAAAEDMTNDEPAKDGQAPQAGSATEEGARETQPPSNDTKSDGKPAEEPAPEPTEGGTPKSKAGESKGGEDNDPPSSDDAKPQPMTRPYLWVVDTVPPIYFLGTIHVPDPRVMIQPEIVMTALKRSDIVLTEINSEEADFEAIRELMRQPPGYLLSRILPADLHARLKAALEAGGQDISKLEHTKVWAASFMLPYKPKGSDEAPKFESMDAAIVAYARADAKEVGALESAIEQLRVFDDMPLNDQIYLLRNAVDGVERSQRGEESPLDHLLDIYLDGDETKLYCALCAELDPYKTGNCAFMCRLLDDRNVRMLDRLFARRCAAPNKTCFVAVGAGHFPGHKGILALMRCRGYTVRRVESLPEGVTAQPTGVATTPDATTPQGTTPQGTVPAGVSDPTFFPAPPPPGMQRGFVVPAPIRYHVYRRQTRFRLPFWRGPRCR